MDVLLVTLQVLVFVPTFLRVARRNTIREIATGISKPILVLHATGALLLWAGILIPFQQGWIATTVSIEGAIGAVLLSAAALLMAWAHVVFRSWRLLPVIEPGHELCTNGPYRLVRHPMYLALDLLGIGSAVWVPTLPVMVGAVLLVIGGDLRARNEEKVLLAAFGERYRDYMKRVRRTIPFLY